MKRLPFRRLAIQVLVVTAALAVTLTSGAPAQSLGDVAKQEGARRKSATPAGKVYTNGDLKGAPQPAASSPSQPPATATPPSVTPDPAPADGAKSPAAKAGDAAKGGDDAPAKGDEAAWRKRRQDIQEAMDRAKMFSDALQSRINGLTTDFAARDDPAQRTVVANDRQKALTELERVKRELAQHTKELADLQEEARKSGVPPGWLR